jgi:hypothetical protein
MNVDDFRQSLTATEPPAGATIALAYLLVCAGFSNFYAQRLPVRGNSLW